MTRSEPAEPDDPAVYESVPDRLAQVCEMYREKEAVRFAQRSTSYAEIGGRIDELAAILNARGVGAGDLVGIGMDRSSTDRGSSTIEVDMVDEGIPWFSDAGSQPARLKLRRNRLSALTVGWPRQIFTRTDR